MPRRAFTLLELVLVLAILVLLTGLIAPSFRALYPGFQVSAAADNLKGAFERTRAHAIDTGVPYRFAIIPGKGNYRAAPDLPAYWASDNSSGSDAQSFPVLQDALPKGVAFNQNDMPSSGSEATVLSDAGTGQYTTLVTFLPDGTARAESVDQSDGAARGLVEVRLWTSGASPLYVTIRTLTGAIKIQKTASTEGAP